jgi:hypothetical protein
MEDLTATQPIWWVFLTATDVKNARNACLVYFHQAARHEDATKTGTTRKISHGLYNLGGALRVKYYLTI